MNAVSGANSWPNQGQGALHTLRFGLEPAAESPPMLWIERWSMRRGGLAYSKSKAHWTESHPGVSNEWDLKDWLFGYSVGGGVEYALSNSGWTVRAEAVYLQYRSELADPVSGSRFQMRVKNSDVIARLGLNYLFGAAAPMVARD
jgi:hypothetical protein